MILLLPGIMIPLLLGPKFSRIGYFFLWLWSWIFSMLTFIRYDLRGRENIQKKTSYIYVSNHTSFLDIPGIRLLIPGEFRPIAKKELLKIPVFGFIVKAATVVVDRSNAQSRKQSIEKLRDILKGGISILVFAEGTQNRTTEILQPFKDGAFRIAIDTQLPIIPLVVIGAGPLMPPGKMDIKPGNIKVVAGEPISVEGLTTDDVQTLKQKTFDTMLGIYKKNS
ncbi:MAG: 1-acyl-sn-glycerol-3-phosphate acyltransferase [Cyclobacteriaceae bacterium]|nr:1-acyl-sn-glycerol-3-phosphate acyltransferase [Cyclobacteriaceae bacterium]